MTFTENTSSPYAPKASGMRLSFFSMADNYTIKRPVAPPPDKTGESRYGKNSQNEIANCFCNAVLVV